MFTVSKRFDFCASHVLNGLREGHQCGRLHGHNYQLILTLSSDQLDEIGFVRDYGELDAVKQWLDINVEHKHLNDVFPFNPTAENMARFFYDTFKPLYPELMMVRVKETEKTESSYTDSPDFNGLMAEFQRLMKEFEEGVKSL